MPSYRFEPAPAGSHFAALSAFALAVFLAPSMVWVALPDKNPDIEQVTLSSPAQGWEVPVDEECAFTAQSQTGWGYACDGVVVSSMVTAPPADMEKGLRRAARAFARMDGQLSDGAFFRVGDTAALVDESASALAIAQPGTGEQEGKLMLAILQGGGQDVTPVAKDTWSALTGKPLPDDVARAVAKLPRPFLAPPTREA